MSRLNSNLNSPHFVAKLENILVESASSIDFNSFELKFDTSSLLISTDDRNLCISNLNDEFLLKSLNISQNFDLNVMIDSVEFFYNKKSVSFPLTNNFYYFDNSKVKLYNNKKDIFDRIVRENMNEYLSLIYMKPDFSLLVLKNDGFKIFESYFLKNYGNYEKASNDNKYNSLLSLFNLFDNDLSYKNVNYSKLFLNLVKNFREKMGEVGTTPLTDLIKFKKEVFDNSTKLYNCLN